MFHVNVLKSSLLAQLGKQLRAGEGKKDLTFYKLMKISVSGRKKLLWCCASLKQSAA